MIVLTKYAVISTFREALIRSPLFTGDEAAAVEIAHTAYEAAVALSGPARLNEITTDAKLEKVFGKPQGGDTTVFYIKASDLVVLVGRGISNICLGHIMRKLGFRHEKPYIDKVRTVIWVRGPKCPAADIPRIGIRYYPPPRC